MSSNTEIEERYSKMYWDVYAYVLKNQQPSVETVEKIREILNSPDCPTYFAQPPPEMIVYRGITEVNIKNLEKILNIDELVPGDGSVPFSGMIRPRYGSAMLSFSQDKDVVERSFIGNFERLKDLYSIIFTARVKDNPGIFLDLSAFYDSNQRIHGYSVEKEIIALGPVKLSHIDWKTL